MKSNLKLITAHQAEQKKSAQIHAKTIHQSGKCNIKPCNIAAANALSSATGKSLMPIQIPPMQEPL